MIKAKVNAGDFLKSILTVEVSQNNFNATNMLQIQELPGQYCEFGTCNRKKFLYSSVILKQRQAFVIPFIADIMN